MNERGIEAAFTAGVARICPDAVVLKLTRARGVPDRLVVWPGGQCEFVELKAAGGRLSPGQVAFLDRLRNANACVTVLVGLESVTWWLDVRKQVLQLEQK